MTHFFPALWISQRKRWDSGGEQGRRRKRGRGEESSRASHTTRESFTPQTAFWHPRLIQPLLHSHTHTHSEIQTANHPTNHSGAWIAWVIKYHHSPNPKKQTDRKNNNSLLESRAESKKAFSPLSISSCQPDSKHTMFGSGAQSRLTTIVSYSPHIFLLVVAANIAAPLLLL